MPEGKKFSHISVNAAEDDDIVIQAGSCQHPDPDPDPSVIEEAYPEEAVNAAGTPAVTAYAGQTPSADAGLREGSASADAPRDAYDQTLEDLEPAPMSKMQRYVLMGLACFVVVFVVYYVIRFVL